MAYKDFSFLQLEQKFGIKQSTRRFFLENIAEVYPSAWLTQTLSIADRLPLRSEKAKSELLIAPVLTELKLKNEDYIQLFSGENLLADRKNKLNGEIDFLFVRYPRAVELRAPIFCIAEAKKGSIEDGRAQCAAQLYGARIYNQKADSPVVNLYGAVTNGIEWQFLHLEGYHIWIDEKVYTIEHLPTLLGVLQHILMPV